GCCRFRCWPMPDRSSCTGTVSLPGWVMLRFGRFQRLFDSLNGSDGGDVLALFQKGEGGWADAGAPSQFGPRQTDLAALADDLARQRHAGVLYGRIVAVGVRRRQGRLPFVRF